MALPLPPDATATGAEERLPEPRPSRLAPVLAALLGAAAVLALLVHTPGRPARAPRPTVTPAPAPTLLPPDTDAAFELYCPMAGDGGTVCSTSYDAPGRFLAAVHSLVPRVANERVRTEQLRPTGPQPVSGLYARLYEGRTPGLVLRVLVRRAGDALTRPRWATSVPHPTVLRSRHRQGGYVVDVWVETATWPRPDAAAVDALARDPRLVQP